MKCSNKGLGKVVEDQHNTIPKEHQVSKLVMDDTKNVKRRQLKQQAFTP